MMSKHSGSKDKRLPGSICQDHSWPESRSECKAGKKSTKEMRVGMFNS